ncbi:hypothetical protein [Desulfoscipio gibsoniae]|uniref:hypothetical protein n=1 Tax=Desulfoscipio gibsoniae TaxID=102134 RepID=UPI000232C07A|nr:hypothetical protein [Desulfoscipio gibsoniae]
MIKRGYGMTSLYGVMKALEYEEVLNKKYKEHPLIGYYKSYGITPPAPEVPI